MDRRIERHDRRRHVQAALVRNVDLANGPALDCMQSDHRRRLPIWAKPVHKTPHQDNSMSHGYRDGPQRLDLGMCPASTNASKTPARRALAPRPLAARKHAARVPDTASVYPRQGPFLNPVALSNIESSHMPAHGRSGMTPRSFLLRSSPGTSLTMQPISKPAQSIHTKPLQNGTRARSTR